MPGGACGMVEQRREEQRRSRPGRQRSFVISSRPPPHPKSRAGEFPGREAEGPKPRQHSRDMCNQRCAGQRAGPGSHHRRHVRTRFGEQRAMAQHRALRIAGGTRCPADHGGLHGVDGCRLIEHPSRDHVVEVDDRGRRRCIADRHDVLEWWEVGSQRVECKGPVCLVCDDERPGAGLAQRVVDSRGPAVCPTGTKVAPTRASP